MQSARRPTGFFKGQLDGQVLGAGGMRGAAGVASVGEDAIARSSLLSGNNVERGFAGAPRFWHVTNRAEKGNVKVWRDTFDGESYPEGATGDKRTWLQPGETMTIPLAAAIHFFGNIFDERLPDCDHIIERTGGFVREAARPGPGNNAQTRIVGGPVGLPDLIIQPQDGRNRNVGEPVALYDVYFAKVKSRIMTRSVKDPALLEEEKLLLEDRLAEYRLDDVPAYPDETEPEQAPKTPRSRT